jgi:hypothetical protein
MLSANSDDDNKEKNEVLSKDNDNDIESKLLRQTNEEEKARKRTMDRIQSRLDLILLPDVIKLKRRASS